ncbi:6-phosphofructo-2-kinase domain-containing protein [Ditylenchus destructor]|nr:6-phosphofructo-2-kinase domain-containing protein [Ditylenchus destructor]
MHAKLFFLLGFLLELCFVVTNAHHVDPRVPTGDVAPVVIPKQTYSRVPAADDGPVAISEHVERVVIALVGLPARGKSYISHRLVHYLNWIGIKTKAFNCGNYRRKIIKPIGEESEGTIKQDADYFDINNAEAKKERDEMADLAIDDMRKYLAGTGKVAILDATNTTRDRRLKLLNKCNETPKSSILFVESVCDIPEFIHDNVLGKLENDDYKNVKDKEKAEEDFRKRIVKYEEQYEPLDKTHDAQLSYIRIINAGKREKYEFVENKIIQGDSAMKKISDFLRELYKNYTMHGLVEPIIYFTQSDREAGGEAHEGRSKKRKRTNPYIEQLMTSLGLQNTQDLGVEYEDGNYGKLVADLEPKIMELQRKSDVLVVTHDPDVLRCILAYFANKNHNILPNVYLDTVIKITLKKQGDYTVEILKFNYAEPGKVQIRETAKRSKVKKNVLEGPTLLDNWLAASGVH